MDLNSQRRIALPGNGWVTINVFGDPESAGLVVLPGVMSDASSWTPTVRLLNNWPSVSVVNRRGRAPSSQLPNDYSAATEVGDLLTVLDALGEDQTVLGWSYGGLVALLASNQCAIRHVIAYEPVIAPFASDALSALVDAQSRSAWDECVELVNVKVSGFSPDYVDDLRAQPDVWSTLREFSKPLATELTALNSLTPPTVLGSHATKVDLIIGESNAGKRPYGSSFKDVQCLIAAPAVHTLPGQGHLAHVYAPKELAALIDHLAEG